MATDARTYRDVGSVDRLSTGTASLLTVCALLIGCATTAPSSTTPGAPTDVESRLPKAPQEKIAPKGTQEAAPNSSTTVEQEQDRFVSPTSPKSAGTADSTDLCKDFQSFENVCAHIQPNEPDGNASNACFPFSCRVSTLSRQAKAALHFVTLAPDTDACFPSEGSSALVVENAGKLWIATTLMRVETMHLRLVESLEGYEFDNEGRFVVEVRRDELETYHEEPEPRTSSITTGFFGFAIKVDGVFSRGEVQVGYDERPGPRRSETDLATCEADCSDEANSAGISEPEDVANFCAWQCADGWAPSADPQLTQEGVTRYYEYPLARGARWPHWKPESEKEFLPFKDCSRSDSDCSPSCVSTANKR